MCGWASSGNSLTPPQRYQHTQPALKAPPSLARCLSVKRSNLKVERLFQGAQCSGGISVARVSTVGEHGGTVFGVAPTAAEALELLRRAGEGLDRAGRTSTDPSL